MVRTCGGPKKLWRQVWLIPNSCVDGGGSPRLTSKRRNASYRNHKQPATLSPRLITPTMASLFRNTLRATAAASSFSYRATRPAALSASLKASSLAARPGFAQPRVAAFHTSHSLKILPAGAREFTWTSWNVSRGIVLLT